MALVVRPMRRFLLGAPLVGALALSALSGCTPTSQYRYSAFVPAAHPLAWDGRTAKDGSLRVEGTLQGATVSRNDTPQLHDTAVRVPNLAVDGAALLAVAPGVEIGGRYTYASYDWSSESAAGTLPLPSRPSLWGIGPEAHFTIPFDRRHRWALGIGGNFLHYEIPYAEWQLASSPCVVSPTCVTDPWATREFGNGKDVQYTLFTERSEAHWAMNLAAYPSVAFGDHGELGHVFAGLSAHTGFKNDGFTNKGQNGSTVEDAGLIMIGGAGYGVSFDGLHLAGMISMPLASGDVSYGPGGFFTFGGDIELWESRQDRIHHETRHAPDADGQDHGD